VPFHGPSNGVAGTETNGLAELEVPGREYRDNTRMLLDWLVENEEAFDYGEVFHKIRGLCFQLKPGGPVVEITDFPSPVLK
jgi:hypothetical protein